MRRPFSADLLRGQEEPATPPRGATQPRSQTPPDARLPAQGRASPPTWYRVSSLIAHRGEKCVSSLDSVPCLGPFVRTHGGGDRPCLRGRGPALSPNWSDTPTRAPLLGPRCFAPTPPDPRARASTAESGLCSRLGPRLLLSCPPRQVRACRVPRGRPGFPEDSPAGRRAGRAWSTARPRPGRARKHLPPRGPGLGWPSG